MARNLSPKKDWSVTFLAMMRQTGNVWKSAEAAGVTRQAAYHRRDHDPEFASEWADAAEEAVDRLELIGRDRAMETSDTLLIFFLKNLRAEIFGDKLRQEVSGPKGQPMQHEHTHDVRDELAADLLGRFSGRAAARVEGGVDQGEDDSAA
jgi:hypothetical protein